MTRHSPAEVLLMVLAVCGALAILFLIGTGLLHFAARSTPPGIGGIAVSVGGVSVIVFSVLLVAMVAVVVAVTFALRSKR
jgi:hypothetical protein